ncbi:uncharacterized protein RCC_00198 [Ramularia collo-cygni]|uniref:Uncharacterized protein n=1 Tax=Ramularia collo-cygni TaxID=112498 RepID=A0A2D3UW15_9PEZI|nr:uncharacterized protein RCC_00198 [Ramularia collo-cygni]CZT14224.1 uncharacterized protein RCC_00198 [Ramularia collo-cygni]
MQYLLLLTATISGLVIATPVEKRQTSGPCFHDGSAALCCPQESTQIVATNCKAPGNTASPDAFRASCAAVDLHAFCCTAANDGTGLICAPSGESPFNPPAAGT